MQNISMNQALSVWSELEQAYYGCNGYGGTTAEIYAYRIQSCNPSIAFGKESVFGEQAIREQAEKAGTSLYHLIVKFRADRPCSIDVDGCDPEVLLREGLVNRCHIRVFRED